MVEVRRIREKPDKKKRSKGERLTRSACIYERSNGKGLKGKGKGAEKVMERVCISERYKDAYIQETKGSFLLRITLPMRLFLTKLNRNIYVPVDDFFLHSVHDLQNCNSALKIDIVSFKYI